LIVQLPLSGAWGSEAELAICEELAAALAEGFRSHGYGHFRGIEDGVGRTSLVFSKRSWDLDTLPAEYIMSELRARCLLDQAIIAYELPSRGSDGERLAPYEVVWPEGFAGSFDLG
jgi:hypothetical protein